MARHAGLFLVSFIIAGIIMAFGQSGARTTRSIFDRVAGIGRGGCVRPLERPGIGLEVNEEFLKKHPVIEGSSYV